MKELEKKEIYNVEIVFFLNLIMFIAYVAPSSNDYPLCPVILLSYIIWGKRDIIAETTETINRF